MNVNRVLALVVGLGLLLASGSAVAQDAGTYSDASATFVSPYGTLFQPPPAPSTPPSPAIAAAQQRLRACYAQCREQERTVFNVSCEATCQPAYVAPSTSPTVATAAPVPPAPVPPRPATPSPEETRRTASCLNDCSRVSGADAADCRSCCTTRRGEHYLASAAGLDYVAQLAGGHVDPNALRCRVRGPQGQATDITRGLVRAASEEHSTNIAQNVRIDSQEQTTARMASLFRAYIGVSQPLSNSAVATLMEQATDLAALAAFDRCVMAAAFHQLPNHGMLDWRNMSQLIERMANDTSVCQTERGAARHARSHLPLDRQLILPTGDQSSPSPTAEQALLEQHRRQLMNSCADIMSAACGQAIDAAIQASSTINVPSGPAMRLATTPSSPVATAHTP